MIKKLASLIALLTLCFLLTANPASAFVSVSFGVAFGNLGVYGSWVDTPTYGEVWYPASTSPGWEPYEDGYWAWTDDGWMWVSYEPWGECYHYGRWVMDPSYGWVWIPGSVWAPAWVTWYVGAGYIGWAPLPPEGFGFVAIQPSYVVFVPTASFLAVNISAVAVAPSQNVTIINNTTNITNVTVVNGTVTDPGPSVATVQRATGRTVQKFNVVSSNDPKAINRRAGNTITAYQPRVTPTSSRKTPLLQKESSGNVQVRGRTLNVQPAPRGQLQTRPAPQQQNRVTPQTQNRPQPQPLNRRPAARPQPQLLNRPAPRPQPQVRPQPQPQNRPAPQPQTRPQPQPLNRPAPRPRPQNRPAPRPQGRPTPTPSPG